MSQDGFFDDPTESGGEFVKPAQLNGHLVILYPIGYIPHLPTRFTRPDKPSDAITCDVIDLDTPGEDGQPGKLYRNVNFMQAQLIQSLRPRIGGRVLGRIGLGVSRNGMNPPWVVNAMSSDPVAVERATAWVQAHQDFKPTEFVEYQPRPQVQQPQGALQGQGQSQGGGYSNQGHNPQQPQHGPGGGYQQDPWQQQQQRDPWQQQQQRDPWQQQQQRDPWQQQQQQQQQPYGGIDPSWNEPGPVRHGPPPEWATGPVQQAATPPSPPAPVAPAVQRAPAAGARPLTPEEGDILDRLQRRRSAESTLTAEEQRQKFGF